MPRVPCASLVSQVVGVAFIASACLLSTSYCALDNIDEGKQPRKGGKAVAEQGSDGFVRRDGSQLVDGNNHPFHIVGTNSYYLLEHASEAESWLKRDVVLETYRAARELGLNTVRTWAFYDGKFQVSPGNYDPKYFDALDYVVSEAKEHGLKLVLSLTNFWEAYGGMQQYVMWANNASSLANLSSKEFYTSPAIKQMYKDNFLAIANRVNNYTGVTYKDDPTILAWELANEPRCPGDATGDVLQSWIEEMSHFIKDEAPDQLVTTGSEGFFGPRTLEYMYLNGNSTWDHANYLPMMCTGVDFLRNHDESTAIDLPSFHLYPDHHAEELCHRGAPADDCALQWSQVQTATRMELANTVLKKPLFLGEFGKMKHPLMLGTLDEQVVYRNRMFTAAYKMIEESALSDGNFAGSTFWMLSSRQYKDYDNYTVYVGGNGPDLPQPWTPGNTMNLQQAFRGYVEELECTKRLVDQHPEWIDHHWYHPGRDSDRWDGTIDAIEGGNHSHSEDWQVLSALPNRWYLDSSTVELIQMHARNMAQVTHLNRHEWWG